MTVEEKVGQLFVVEVFGQDANNVTDAQAASNEAKYGSGVRTPADVVNKYQPGGVIYFDPRRAAGSAESGRTTSGRRIRSPPCQTVCKQPLAASGWESRCSSPPTRRAARSYIGS